MKVEGALLGKSVLDEDVEFLRDKRLALMNEMFSVENRKSKVNTYAVMMRHYVLQSKIASVYPVNYTFEAMNDQRALEQVQDDQKLSDEAATDIIQSSTDELIEYARKIRRSEHQDRINWTEGQEERYESERTMRMKLRLNEMRWGLAAMKTELFCIPDLRECLFVRDGDDWVKVECK